MADKERLFDLASERGVLRTGIAVGFVISALGIGFGLASGSFSIMFDGFYSLVDLGMSGLSLMVVNLITAHAVSRDLPRRLRERFSMGFWHLEPMVLGLNGILLMSVALYALFNAVSSLLAGGRDLAFGVAIVYAVITIVLGGTIALVEIRANRKINSDFVRLDISGWVMSTGITAALLVAFCIGYFIQGTRYAWLSPYVDPAVLALVCLAILPVPFATVRRALSDVLLMTPDSLREHVEQVAAAFVEKHGLASYRAYTARVGRSNVIELHFIVRDGDDRAMSAWDALRDEVGTAIGQEGPHRWLTVVFTGDTRWAE